MKADVLIEKIMKKIERLESGKRKNYSMLWIIAGAAAIILMGGCIFLSRPARK